MSMKDANPIQTNRLITREESPESWTEILSGTAFLIVSFVLVWATV